MRILMFIFVTFSLLAGSPADSLFIKANGLYDGQQYDSAATLYSEAIQYNGESSVLY